MQLLREKIGQSLVLDIALLEHQTPTESQIAVHHLQTLLPVSHNVQQGLITISQVHVESHVFGIESETHFFLHQLSPSC